jgi:tetratricopeptide (TPR) repeat protein
MLQKLIATTSVLVLLVAASSCSTDPAVAKKKHVDAGARYFKAAKYREAVLEYRSAIRIDGAYPEARLGLAETYERAGDLQNAYREYVRAADVLPARLDIQLRAGNFLLVAGRFEDARARAEKVLQSEPNNVEAQVLLGYSLAGLKRLDDAVIQLERALMRGDAGGDAFSNLGTLQMARGDLQQAEATFRKAITLSPDAPMPWVALANFLWARERFAEAEACLVKARQLAPNDLVAARALAILYVTSNRASEAEPILKEVADTGAPTAVLMLADYYSATGKLDAALATLARLSSNKAFQVEAQGRAATIMHGVGRGAEAYAIVDRLIKGHPDSVVARLLRAQFLLRDRRLDEALAEGQKAVTFDSRSALGHRIVGETHAARFELDEAAQALRRSLDIEPTAVATQLQLARIELARGRPGAAIDYAQQVLRTNRDRLDARLVLTAALIQRREVDAALPEVRRMATQYPQSADVQIAAGRLALLKNDTGTAGKAFGRALELAPDSIDALTGAVDADYQSRDVASARRRVDARLARTPNDAQALLLSAQTFMRANDFVNAEIVLKRVLEVDPDNLPAYDLLGRIYLSQQRLSAAQAEFESLARRRPNSVGARTMVATLLHLQNRIDEAREQYESIVQTYGDAAVASNNLAWLYANSEGNLDVALTLAQSAKKELPHQAEVSDTLGWVYYRKGLFPMAVMAFEQSLQTDPNNPLYHYHLGLAQAGLGDKDLARKAIERALALNPRFDGADDARRLSSELGSRGGF